jgi:hypothetical protein
MWRVTCSVLTAVFALSGCVQEEQALTNNQSDPIGNGGGNPSAALAITAPAAMDGEATGPTTTMDIGQATAVGGDGAYTFSHDAPPAGFGLGTTSVTWIVQDGTGTTASAAQNVTVSDTTAPTINRPPDMQVVSTGGLTMVDIGTATATDLVDMSPAVDNDMPADGFPMGMTPVTWTATDASSNTATAMQMVNVAPPSSGPLAISAPGNVAQEATAPLSMVMLGNAIITGGDAPIMINNDAPAGGYPVGTTTITWTATDAAMASATATQQVTIVDTTAPQLAVPTNVTTSQGPELGDTIVMLGTASASDIADPSPTISNDAPANGFPVGTTTVVWTAQDASGNTTTANQTVTVDAYVVEQCSALLSDFQNSIYPVMDRPDPLRCSGCHTGPTTEQTANGFAFSNVPPTMADLDTFIRVARIQSGGESLITVKARGGDNHGGGNRFPDGLDDPDYFALSDFATRAEYCVTQLTITAPASVSAEASGPLTTVDTGQATAVGGDGTYTFGDDVPAGGFGLGTTVVTWTVTDGAGASDSATQDVIIFDTTAPTVTAPPAIQADSTGGLTMVDIGTATVTDLVDSSPSLSSDAPTGGFPDGTTVVTWTASDASGNVASATQTVTVAPSAPGALAVTAPSNITQEATASLSTVSLGVAMASGGVAPTTITNNAPSGFPVGATTVTWTATDSTNATATASQLVTITDTTAPQLVAPGDVMADQGAGLGNTSVDIGNASSTDIADANPLIGNDAPTNGFPVGNTIVTWTAQDASGNTATATQTITVNAYVVEQCSQLEQDFAGTIYPIMNSTSPRNCEGCHTGAPPLLDTPNGFAFPNEPPTAGDFEVFRTVANIDFGNESLITVKARGGASHTGGDRFPDGLNDPDFAELASFVSRARNCQPDPDPGTEKVMLGTGYEQLHRIVSTLGSRTPSVDETNLVAAAGDQASIDSALEAIMDGLLNEAAFYARVQEMYNDLLLTDKDADDRGSVGDNFDLDAFANRDYYDDNFSGDTRNNLREKANFGISRAPLALIEYVVANDRPFTEILTADYLMVNPYSAVIFGVDAGDPGFPFSSDNNEANHDADDFRPVSNLVQQAGDQAQVPLAGVIATHAFLARYPSTNTNVNRKRARYVFDYFLGVNIEGLAARDGLDLDNVIGDVPTFEDPQCTVCHEVMDPIAGLFTKRDNGGEYDLNNGFRHNQTTSGVPRMVPAGYSLDPADVLPTSEENQALKWLTQRMAADDRFADRTVRTVLRGLTGIEATAPATIAFINETKNRFVASNYDFKRLVKDVMLSDHFRGQNLAPTENPSSYADVGTGRMLTPEELGRRIRAVTGGNYDWRGPNSNSGLGGRHYMLYGGIDSDEVTARTTEPTSLIDGVQERIANQVACERVASDLYNSGSLFPIADATDIPDNQAGEDAIRQNIVYLHRLLLGEDRGVNDAEVDASYQLFLDVRAVGDTAIPSQCRGGGNQTDTNGTVLPWMAVVSYLLTDYRFLYE